MSQSDKASLIPFLEHALNRIRSTPPRIISSPPTQPRRAAVALILRVSPPPDYPLSPTPSSPLTLQEFFAQDWISARGSRAEILFLRREKSDSNGNVAGTLGAKKRGEAHVAFPGGRMEDGDEGGLYTAMRQTWDEIGIDLADREYICVGQLDDREITTSLGKRLLMVLSPFVFLYTSPHPPPSDPPPETSLHWISLSMLMARRPKWTTVTVDISSRLAPRHSLLRALVRLLIGSMKFGAIILDENGSNAKGWEGPKELRLWGLTLGMMLDFMAFMRTPEAKGFPAPDDFMGPVLAPSMTSVFPRFSYPDVNFWIWVFGKRYRAVVRDWEASIRAGGSNDKRINWTGSALQTFYAAVRKALIIVIVLRALGLLAVLGVSGWWIWARR